MRSSNAADHLSYIDALRGIAILGVIAYHAGQHLHEAGVPLVGIYKGGQYGVQLFFVASAFTLALSHHRRQSEPAATSRFFARRFFRIAPAYYLGLAGYCCLRAIHEGRFPPDQYNLFSVATNVFFVHGFFPDANNYVVPGGWSIAAEMLFYALLPVALRWITSWRSAVVAWVVACAIGLGAGSVVISGGWQTRLVGEQAFYFYYWLPNQLSVFAAGIAVYFFMQQQGETTDRKKHVRIAQVLFLGLVAVAAVVLFNKFLGDWSRTITPIVNGLCFSCLLYIVSAGGWRMLVNRWTRSFGVYSFGGYLTHFAVIWMLIPRVVDLLPTSMSKFTALGVWVLASSLTAALTWVAAAVVYHLVEVPGMELGKRFVRRFLSPTPQFADSFAPQQGNRAVSGK